jgi:hypothetical protein
MRVIKGIPLLLVILTALFLSGQTLAQSDQGESARVFGLGQPTSVQSLPAGKLRNRLESLPPQTSGKALRWLQDFSFPEADLETIEVDDEGNVFYGDTLLPDPEEVDGAASAGPTLPANAPTATLDDAFSLHSRSGSSNVVFIDFDGAIITGTAWNGTHSQLDALPYNVEGDGSTFSTLERTRIVDIWHRVSEDLAAYDIDVTTEEPATFTSTTGTILVTNSVDANGNNINCTSCGGVAYVGVFGRSNYHTYYSPALVFFNKLGGGGETYVAEASSHEFGHNLGLSHDGTNAGTTYYSGHGSGLVSWAPIMGNSYNNNITEWSIGEYPDANQQQDDLDIIDGKLGYRPDDHGDTRAAAATLAVDPDGSVVASNPELDPHNVLTENKGVIGSSADVDVFSFVSGDGTVNLTVNPGWDAFYRSSSRRGSNLDIEAELQDLSGATVALSDPNTDTAASINASVSAGTYYLLVTGVGNAVTPYSDYNSMGQYFVNGSVPAASVDTTKPTPNPMGWASAPSATSDSAINMTALTASDDISAVEYNFLCTFGGTGCANSGWQSGTSHTASGLAASTSYTFQVKARDQAGNETAPSGSVSVSTDAPPAYTNYSASGETMVAGSVSGSVSNTVNDDDSSQSITERDSGGKPANRHTYLEHRWNFNVSAGATTTVYANIWSGDSTDDDTFNLEYSLDNGGNFYSLFNVSSTASSNMQFAAISGNHNGSIIIRVVDTDQTRGHREQNTVFVDHLYIQVGNPSNDPPDGNPANLNATAASSSQINLTWTNGSSNESGFKVERSADGSSGWTEIADLPATSTSHSDTGLTAEKTYYYRVSAYTQLEMISAYASANATTPVAPPPPALSLSASGYKAKGKHGVNLSWSGSTSVDVYRDGSLLNPSGVVSGSTYDDYIGTKGGATYTHQVCQAETTTCSKVTTTVF